MSEKNNSLEYELDQLKKENEELKEDIEQLQLRIDILRTKERKLDAILNSKGYKIMNAGWNVLWFLVPQNSKRERVIRGIGYAFGYLRPSKMREVIACLKTYGLMATIKRSFAIASGRIVPGHNGGADEMEPLDLLLENVQLDENNEKIYDKLSFPVYEKPLVSIIIPVYNQFEYTYLCLKTILKNTKGIAYEVIIGDDNSTDETKDIRDIVENITVVRNAENLRFLLNVNNASNYARGEYILFLNNDTQVQKNWLSSLLELIEKDETIGMVGSKLVYPDGTLQEAGGIIFGNGNAWNFGNGKSPNAPEYNYVKEVDYISGASIMIRKSLWETIGGFDERFVPAYCEDSDLAFEVRKQGYKVVYQPKSVVVHFEGKSNGTDLKQGIKQYQVVNAEKLKEKWSVELGKQVKNETYAFVARDRSCDKKTILVIDHYVPQFDRDAGSKTVYQYLKMFIDKGFKIIFVPDNFQKDEKYGGILQQLGIEVLYGPWYSTYFWDWIEQNYQFIDYVYMNRPHITIKYIDKFEKYPNMKLIYYGHDLHFLRIQREYELNKDNKLLKEVADWKKQELYIMKKAAISYYPSNIEEKVIHELDSSIKVKAITAYVYDTFIEQNYYEFKDRKGIMFVGGFGHPPNIDAVKWFVEEVYPQIKQKMDIPFYIVGSNPTKEILAYDGNGIIVKGFVSEEELKRLYSMCKMAVVPLRYGAGVKGKVVEALYYGIPLITTSVGAEGIEGIENVVEICDEPEQFANKVVELYDNDVKLEKMALTTQSFVRSRFCTDAVWDIIKEDFQ